MEADALAQSKQFLKQIINERLSTPPDEFVHPCLAGNYSLKPEEVKGEVCDWVLNYLERSHCPHQLAIFIASTIAGQISASVIEKLAQSDDSDPYPTVNASALHMEVLPYLHELCCEFLDSPKKMAACNFEKASPFLSSIFAIKNKRRKMEDRHVVIHDLNSLLNLEKSPALSYFAVYDGHAGIDAANFAAAHLHEDIVQHPDFSTDTVKAIKEAYNLTDVHICERAIREGIKGGCTVVSALFRDKTMYLSWVGDSQAILVKEGKSVTLMNPHKPDREDEKKRIEDAGGFVYFVGTWRVNGTLAVARSLGDHEFKPHVSSDPDVTMLTLDGTEDFLVLACDGLWDGMSYDEVTSVLYRNILDHSDDDELLVDTLAEKLAHQSKLQGSEDNISVIVVLLRNLADIRASASAFSDSTFHMNGKSENYVIEVNESILKQQLENNTIVVQNQAAERPRDLHDLTSFPSLNTEQCTQSLSPNHGLAASLPPEATALSELPTPPIDDITPPGEFSELSCAEQVEQLQFHLQSTGFQGTSFGEQKLNNPDQDIDVLQKSITEAALDPPDYYTTEVSSGTVFPVNELSVRDVSPEKAAMDIASDLISNTIESAIEKVNLSSDSALEKVNLSSDSALEKVNLSSDPALEKVNLSSDSALEKVNLSSDSALEKVNLSSDSALEKVNLSSDSALEKVNLSLDPALEKVNLSSDPALEKVNLSSDPALEKVNLSSDPALEKVNLSSDSALEKVNLSSDSALEKVNLSSDSALEINGTPHSRLNPNAEPFVMKNFSPESPVSDAMSPISADNVQPLASFESNPFIIDSPKDNKSELLFSEDSLHNADNTEEFENSAQLVIDETKLISEENSGLISTNPFSMPNTEQILTTDLDAVQVDLIPDPFNEEPCLMGSDIPEQTSQLLEPSFTDNMSNLDLNTEHSIEQIDHEKIIEVTQAKDGIPPSVVELSDSLQKCSLDEISGVNEVPNTSECKVEITQLATEVPKVEEKGESFFSENVGFESTNNNEQIPSIPLDGLDVGKDNLTDGVSKETCQQEPVNSIVNELEFANKDTLSAGDASQQVAGTENNISPSISKQVIGVDSLLPKEVQDELLKVAENVQPETAPEDAVDLKSVPDGIPEADGVSEDIDSDSEKDGGWSYVKANEGLTTKTEPADTKSSAIKVKSTVKKPSLLSQTKKEPAKPLKDATTRSKISGLSDKTKKLPMEKKATEAKVGSASKSSATNARPTPISKTTKPPLSSVSKSLPQKAVGEANAVPTRPAISKSAVKTQTTTTRVVTKTNVPASAKPLQPKASTTVGATSRPTTRPASGAPVKDRVPNAVPRTGTSSVAAKPPTRLPAAPQVSKSTIPSRQPSRPGTGTEAKPSGFKKPLLPATKKPENKDEKSVNKSTVTKKLPPSTVQPVHKPLFTSTPKSNLTSKPKPLSQPRVVKNGTSTKVPLVEPSKQHVGLKPPRTVLKTSSDKAAKSRKDITKKPNALVPKSDGKNEVKQEEPKIETKEELVLNSVTIETKSVCSVTTEHIESVGTVAVEYTDTSSTEVKNEVLVEPVATENIIL